MSPLLICTAYQHLLGQIEQRNKKFILPVLPASPGSGSGSSDHLPPAAKKASTEERRTEINVDSYKYYTSLTRQCFHFNLCTAVVFLHHFIPLYEN